MALPPKRPEISLDDQNTILELLCKYASFFLLPSSSHTDVPPPSLLSPFGQYCRVHVRRSKGKRARRRRNKTGSQDGALAGVAAPPRPELHAKVDIGFSSITRRLETLSQTSCDTAQVEPKDCPYSMVFVARGNQSSAFNCHFPTMVGVASRDTRQADKTRLVGFSRPCSDRLGSILGVARVSSLAVARDAPGAGALWEFVQKTVAPVCISWLQDATCPEYRAAKISSVETSVGISKAKTT